MPPNKSESPSAKKSETDENRTTNASEKSPESPGRNKTKQQPRNNHKNTGLKGSASDREDSDSERGQDYVKFISTKERRVCDDGFIDSRRYRSAFGDKGGGSSKRPKSVVDVTIRTDEEQKEYEKRLKMIEELMWKHKQEARELHHDSGSIVKKQRAVRRTLQEYEQSINQKRLDEDKKLNMEMSKYTSLQQQQEHEKKETGRRRLESDQNETKEFKDKDYQSKKKTTDLARQYQTKMAALELKHTEMDVLNKEYTAKIQAKEEEQYRLKQELADIAVVLNMEAHKGQEKEQDFQKTNKQLEHERVKEDREAEKNLKKTLAESTKDAKATEQARRKLSLELTMKSARLEAKYREEERRKIDTERRMQENRDEQKRLEESARATENEIHTRRLTNRIEEHGQRKKETQDTWLRGRQQKKDSDTAVYSERFERRHHEETRRKHEDHLNHFQRAVMKGEQQENDLYHKLKEAEQTSQQLEQSVRKYEHHFVETRRSNAARIKEEMTEMAKQEQEIEHTLLRERASLHKAHACRDESYQELQRHRERLRHDRYLLSEHEREHNRLARVGQRSDAMTSRD